MSPAARERAAQRVDAVIRARGSSLVLGGLGLKELPQNLSGVRELQMLDLCGNRLSNVPAAVWELERLEHLDLGANRLAHLDPGIARLRRLRILDASENRLTALAVELGPELRELHLYGNQLATIPAEVLRLDALEVLDLSGNHIAALPSLTGHWSALRVLDLSGNELVELPEGIGALRALRVLDLSGEPAALGRRSRLAGEARRALPRRQPAGRRAERLAALPALRIISAERNAVEKLPEAFAGVDAAAVRRRAVIVLRERVAAGTEADVRYADEPRFDVGTEVAVDTASSVRRLVDVYYKHAASVPAITLRYPAGNTVPLGKLTRKSALSITSQLEDEIAPDGAVVVAVHDPVRSAEIDALAGFTGEIAARIPDARRRRPAPASRSSAASPISARFSVRSCGATWRPNRLRLRLRRRPTSRCSSRRARRPR